MEKRDDIIDAFVKQYVHEAVQRLVGRYGITQSDVPLIKQDLFAHLHLRYPKFNPERGRWTTFSSTAVDHEIASMVRKRCAEKRDYRREAGSLNAPLKGNRDDLWERAQLFDDRAGRGHRGQHPRSDQDRAELNLDIHAVMNSLSPELRVIWRLIAEYGQEKAAKTLGMPPSEMQSHVSEIRRRGEDAGLRRYL